MKLLSFIFFLFAFTAIKAQPKRELRGAWVATVSNIDWPSSRTLTAAQQQAEIITILDQHKATGINAIYLQVRGECDAIYPSNNDPWSFIFNNTQGATANPGYDPLQYWITECRKRGMEFHAWFNPYRAVINNNNIATYANTHIAVTRPDLLLTQGTLRVLDPGKPEVIDYVLKVFMDVLRRYDVDGIHFDDYFYPYPPSTGLPYNDDATFASFPRGFTDKLAWRRANVDSLIKRTYDSVKLVKPWVKFGVSPFGIWRNQGTNALGSATNGLQSYDDIHADTRSWMLNNWVDYMMPQIYWSIGFSAANYAVLAPWWHNNANGRHIYLGQAAYKVNNNADVNWSSPSQIPSQIRLHRTYANIYGSTHFSTKNVNANPLGMRDSLRNDLYKSPSIIPTMAWRDNIAPAAPSNLTYILTGTNVELTWQKPTTTTDELQKVRQFVVYRSTSPIIDITNANNIRTVTNIDTTKYTDVNVPAAIYYYTITSLDRMYNESVVSNNVMVSLAATSISSVNALIPSLVLKSSNPAQDAIKIQFTLTQTMPVSIQLINEQGIVVKNTAMTARPIGVSTYTINIESIPNGMYTIVLQTKQGRKSIKVLVQQ
jgi:uncharacterized lipoprotein YddW (UPF0748 family)